MKARQRDKKVREEGERKRWREREMGQLRDKAKPAR